MTSTTIELIAFISIGLLDAGLLGAESQRVGYRWTDSTLVDQIHPRAKTFYGDIHRRRANNDTITIGIEDQHDSADIGKERHAERGDVFRIIDSCLFREFTLQLAQIDGLAEIDGQMNVDADHIGGHE